MRTILKMEFGRFDGFLLEMTQKFLGFSLYNS